MHPPSNPPNLQNLQARLLGGGFTLPLPPPTGRGRSVVRFPGVVGPSLRSKILRKNEYILFMDPFGTNNDTIKPATIHIIHAIRRLYAQSAPKVTPKWTQIHLHMPKAIPKQPQIDPKSTKQFYKIIEICRENECFLKDDLHIPKVNPQ